MKNSFLIAFPGGGPIRQFWVAAAIACLVAPISAATCPFDAGGSDPMNDGVVLTRFALGITGAPLIANTKFASIAGFTGADAQANIQCTACGLDVDGNGQIDAIDSTVIARHLTGFKGASLTNGLGLSASAVTAVNSFIVNGCAVGGAINAFVQGGNAFGQPAVLGTTDNQNLTLGIGGGNGVRIVQTVNAIAPNMVSGSSSNFADLGDATRGYVVAATIAGGASNLVRGSYGTVGGGLDNSAGDLSVGANGSGYATVAGGLNNSAWAELSVISGGQSNYAFGPFSTVPGGKSNTARGVASFAAGQNAFAADRTFVWNSYGTRNEQIFRPDSFRVGAANGFDVNFGVNKEHYFATNLDVAGYVLSTSTGAKLSLGGVWTNNSSRDSKENFSRLDSRAILKKTVALPVTMWNYKAEGAAIKRIGPMAQDFRAAFGLGIDDTSIGVLDASGVALAAIQGLNQKLNEEVKSLRAKLSAKDAEATKLNARLAAIEKRLGLN